MSVRVINAEIKCCTPFYTFGENGAMTYPITPGQYNKLSINECVWFLATPDEKFKHYKAEYFNGRIYRIRCKVLKEYIDNNRHIKKLIKYNHEGKPRIIIPIEYLKEVGRIDEKIIQESGISGAGDSAYSTDADGKYIKDFSKNSTDNTNTSKKGTIGEFLMKQYFEENGAEYAEIQPDPYGKTDLKIGYNNDT